MYQALYTKWRPKTFDDVYGQQHVTKTLKNEISTGRISHAYLFTGSRGTGKTSCARILSKAVNCLNPVDGNPCGECEICKSIENNTMFDITEIDAASNNSVDNIRDLREEVNFTPAVAKYRIYIIDEVHMLSAGAFNALLKTLEEPPAHVIFILATTEIHKLPATILSRCQRFDFKRIAPSEIVRRIKYVASGENVKITDEAANLIANISDGGMRDAISMLDRCLSVTDDIDDKTVSDVAGIAGTAHMFMFSDYISKRDCSSALKLVAELHSNFCDVDRICVRLAEHFRNLMVAYSVNNCEDLIVCSESELEKYKLEAKKFRLSKILECIDIIAQTSKNIKGASDKRIQFEAAVIKMCSAGNSASVLSEDFDARITALENKINQLKSGNIQASPAPSAETKPADTISETPATKPEEIKKTEQSPAETQINTVPGKKPINPPVIDASKSDISSQISEPSVPAAISIPDGPFSEWADVLENLMMKDMPLYGLLSDTTATVNMGKLVIRTENRTLYDFINAESNRSHYHNLLKSIFDITGQKMKVIIHCVAEKQQKKNSEDESPFEKMLDKINKFNNQGE